VYSNILITILSLGVPCIQLSDVWQVWHSIILIVHTINKHLTIFTHPQLDITLVSVIPVDSFCVAHYMFWAFSLF
jgi:hypothetical protein